MAYGRHAAAAVDIFGQMYVLGGIGQGGVSLLPFLVLYCMSSLSL